MAISRQKATSVAEKTRWALRNEQKFKGLIAGLDCFIKQLEDLFPATEFPRVEGNQQRLATSEAQELVQPSEVEEPEEGGSSPRDYVAGSDEGHQRPKS